MRFAQNASAAALLELELLELDVITDEDVDVLVGAGLEVADDVAADVGLLAPPPPPPPPQAVSKLVRAMDKNQGVVRMLKFSY